MGPAAGPAGIRRIHPGPEIAMNPRNLPTASASMPPAMRGDANAVDRTAPQVYHPQVRILDLLDDSVYVAGRGREGEGCRCPIALKSVELCDWRFVFFLVEMHNDKEDK